MEKKSSAAAPQCPLHANVAGAGMEGATTFAITNNKRGDDVYFRERVAQLKRELTTALQHGEQHNNAVVSGAGHQCRPVIPCENNGGLKTSAQSSGEINSGIGMSLQHHHQYRRCRHTVLKPETCTPDGRVADADDVGLPKHAEAAAFCCDSPNMHRNQHSHSLSDSDIVALQQKESSTFNDACKNSSHLDDIGLPTRFHGSRVGIKQKRGNFCQAAGELPEKLPVQIIDKQNDMLGNDGFQYGSVSNSYQQHRDDQSSSGMHDPPEDDELDGACYSKKPQAHSPKPLTRNGRLTQYKLKTTTQPTSATVQSSLNAALLQPPCNETQSDPGILDTNYDGRRATDGDRHCHSNNNYQRSDSRSGVMHADNVSVPEKDGHDFDGADLRNADGATYSHRVIAADSSPPLTRPPVPPKTHVLANRVIDKVVSSSNDKLESRERRNSAVEADERRHLTHNLSLPSLMPSSSSGHNDDELENTRTEADARDSPTNDEKRMNADAAVQSSSAAVAAPPTFACSKCNQQLHEWDRQSVFSCTTTGGQSGVSVQLLQNRIQEMQENHYTTNEELQAIYQELTDLQVAYEELVLEKDSLSEDKNILLESLHTQTEKLEACREQVEHFTTLLCSNVSEDQRNDEILNADEKLKLISADSNTTTQRERRLIAVIQFMQTEKHQYEEQKRHAQERYDGLKDMLDEVQRALDDVQQQCKQKDRMLLSFKNQLRKQKDGNQHQLEEIRRLTACLTREKDKQRQFSSHKDTSKLLGSLEAIVNKSEHERVNAERELNGKCAELEQKAREIAKLEDWAKSLAKEKVMKEDVYRQEIGVIQQRLRAVEAERDQKIEALRRAQEELTNAKSSERDAQRRLSELEQRYRDECDEWETFQNDLLVTVRVANELKSEAQEELEQMQEALQTAQKRCAQLEKDMLKLQDASSTSNAVGSKSISMLRNGNSVVENGRNASPSRMLNGSSAQQQSSSSSSSAAAARRDSNTNSNTTAPTLYSANTTTSNNSSSSSSNRQRRSVRALIDTMESAIKSAKNKPAPTITPTITPTLTTTNFNYPTNNRDEKADAAMHIEPKALFGTNGSSEMSSSCRSSSSSSSSSSTTSTLRREIGASSGSSSCAAALQTAANAEHRSEVNGVVSNINTSGGSENSAVNAVDVAGIGQRLRLAAAAANSSSSLSSPLVESAANSTPSSSRQQSATANVVKKADSQPNSRTMSAGASVKAPPVAAYAANNNSDMPSSTSSSAAKLPSTTRFTANTGAEAGAAVTTSSILRTAKLPASIVTSSSNHVNSTGLVHSIRLKCFSGDSNNSDGGNSTNNEDERAAASKEISSSFVEKRRQNAVQPSSSVQQQQSSSATLSRSAAVASSMASTPLSSIVSPTHHAAAVAARARRLSNITNPLRDPLTKLTHGHGSKRNALLKWCQEKTMDYQGVDITNFSASWSDGLALCALLASLGLPIPYKSLNSNDKRRNFDVAFKAAAAAGVPAPPKDELDLSDLMNSEWPDWRPVFKYVTAIYAKFDSGNGGR